MAVVLLCFSLLSNSFRASVSKVIARDYLSKGEDVFLFNAIGALSASLILLVVKGFRIQVDAKVVLLSIVFASIYLVAFLSYSESLVHGSLSFTTLITSLGMVIPMLYGIVFLSEQVTITLVIGCILMVIALVMLSLKGGINENKFSPKWLFWVSISFLASGALGLFQKLFVSTVGNVDSLSFMCMTFFFLFVLSVLVLLIKRKSVAFGLKRVTLSALQGLFDASQHSLNLLLASMVPAVVLYPVLNGGATLLSVLVALIFFKEKLDAKGVVTIVLLIASILMISL